MSMDTGALTLQIRTCPTGDIMVHFRPEESGCDELFRGSYQKRYSDDDVERAIGGAGRDSTKNSSFSKKKR